MDKTEPLKHQTRQDEKKRGIRTLFDDNPLQKRRSEIFLYFPPYQQDPLESRSSGSEGNSRRFQGPQNQLPYIPEMGPFVLLKENQEHIQL